MSHTVAAMWPGVRSAHLADALDALGLRRQCLGPDIKPQTGIAVLHGRAFTARAGPVDKAATDPYAGLRSLLTRLGPGDVLVLATDRTEAYAGWGELVSIAARASGAIGMVTNGLVRDLAEMADLEFVVYARGTTPMDISGRAAIVEIGDPVIIDAVRIATGDLVVADADGIVAVPAAYIDRATAAALKAARAEREFRDAVEGGMDVLLAMERFGVF